MEVSKDKYELPLIVADTNKELAEITGVTCHLITETVYKGEQGKIKSKYVRVRREP